MSAFTNLAILAAAFGGTYYAVEWRPAQERKKKKAKAKKKKVCPPGTTLDSATGECVGLGDPSAEHCVTQGGAIEVRTSTDGGQYGVCVFPDGREVEAWAYMRGEAQPEFPAAPEPPLPGPQPMIKPPPQPGEIMLPKDHEVPALADQLDGVPTVIIAPIAMKSVFTQKVLPMAIDLAGDYKNLQFVELPMADLMGEGDSNVVLLEAGIRYNGEQEGTSMFLADEPPSARDQLATNQESIEPTFDAIDINTADMETTINQVVAVLEKLSQRVLELKGTTQA